MARRRCDGDGGVVGGGPEYMQGAMRETRRSRFCFDRRIFQNASSSF